MIKDIQELNFPSYATMSAATVSQPDMGEWNITSQIKIDGDLAPDFSFDWEVVHDGHKYIMPLRIPAGSKDNQKPPSVIDLTFQHWAIWQLKRFPFVTMQPIDSGTAVADEEVATVSLNLGDFCKLFAQVLNYYYGDKITLDFNDDPETGWQYKAEAEVITISHTKVWNVLIEVFHKQFGVRWAIEPNGNYDKYVIKVGYPTTEQSHIFEYGFEGGLMKVERQVQSEEICNLLKGRGGEKNLPAYYFKDVDPENPSFKADPDWIEELANIYFTNLMPATFRSYVQGWKAAHISKYPGYTATGEANAYAPWAYRKGFTDTKFHPVEFVADEITINPEEGDRQVEILPGYSPFVKKGSSLDKYGALMNSLDNNEDIYPTIQGVTVDPYGRIDEVIEVEPITSDDIEEAVENDAKISTFKQPWPSKTEKVAKVSRKVIELTGDWFTVPTGKHANFDEGRKVIKLTKDKYTFYYDFSKGQFIVKKGEEEITLEGVVLDGSASVELQSAAGGIVSASGIPSGTYRYKVSCKIYNSTNEDFNVTVALDSPTLTDATLSDKWSGVWRIWVKNIWGTTKLATETDEQYAKRVWEPILGDRVGNEAKVIFASGMLAHEDYEFVITSIPKYDPKKCTWQTVENGQVVEHEYYSEWCIELGKSDAELETLGVYLPSTKQQGKAGDFFLFIGIDMPHLYVKWGEERVDNWKKDNLQEKKDIKPTWVVQTDRVRLNNEGKPNALIRQLHPGDTLRLADKRFIEGDYETLYLSSLTITYREPTSDDAALNPDVEIVLSDRYEVSANPVATLQGEVSALVKQVGSISNVEQIVRAVGDKLYLRKDGLPDRSMSPTEFASLLTSLGFRSGMVGGAGWGIYKDANGRWVIEADRFMAREDLEVNNLVINQVTGQGGTIVESAARMEITRVEDTANGYKCYFDQHEGTVANLFHVDDIAWNSRFTPENADLKFYRRRVTEVGADYVVLSKTDVNGSGIPAEGDVIVQRGNYTDANRQFIKVRDVIGGGYERYIEGLDSVNAEGVEYYFVGKQDGQNPRWFIGNKDLIPGSGENDGSFIEYKDREFNLNNVALSIGSRIGDTTLGDIVQSFDASKYLREALNQSTVVNNGLVLTSAILLGYKNQLGERVTMAGHNGLIPDSMTDLVKRGRVIASWWGGDMVDKFYGEDGNALANPLSSEYATALTRMDGTGYWCGGNIRFEKDYALFGSEEKGVKIGVDGTFIVGSGVKFGVTNVEGLNATLNDLANFNIGLMNLFSVIGTDNQEHPLSYAFTNFEQVKSIKAKRGLWTESFLSARGQNSDGGGSSGGGGLIHQVYNADDFGGAFDKSNLTDTFNAHAVNSLYEALGDKLSKVDAATLYQPKGDYALASALAGYVTLDTTQTITGAKTFQGAPLKIIGNAISANRNTAGVLAFQENGYDDQFGIWAYFSGTTSNQNLYIGGSGSGAVLANTADGTNFTPYLTIQHTTGNLTVLGKIIKSGGTSSQFLKADGSVTEYSALENAFVNKSGDMMTGVLSVRDYMIAKISSGENKAAFGWSANANYGSYLYSYASNKYLGIKDDGTPHFNGNTLWHAGNDGGGSGLDADLLDGVHNGDLTANKWNIYGAVADFNATMNRNGIYTWGSNIPNQPNAYGSMLQWSNQNIPTGGTSQHWITQLASSTNNRLYYRTRTNTANWESWSTIAFTSDNVASATKLQTARYLWGRPFDGTENVTGAISGAGDITPALTHTSSLGSSSLVWERIYGRYIDTDSGYDLRICAAGTERIHVNYANSYIGINTQTPLFGLDINDYTIMRNSLYFLKYSKGLYFEPASDGRLDLCTHINGDWQSTNFKFNYDGSFFAKTGVYSDGYISARGQNTSDMRIKERLEDIELTLDQMASAPIFNFTFRDTGKWSQGTSAQYMEGILPSTVWDDPDGIKAFDYGRAAFLFCVSLAREVKKLRDKVSDRATC